MTHNISPKAMRERCIILMLGTGMIWLITILLHYFNQHVAAIGWNTMMHIALFGTVCLYKAPPRREDIW